MTPATAQLGSQTAHILPPRPLYPAWAARSVLCVIKNQEICMSSADVYALRTRGFPVIHSLPL